MKLVAILLAGLLVLTGCNEPGTVTGRDKDCLPGSTDEKPLCTYQLKTSGGWFDVIKDVYEQCGVGEEYPRCGDKR